MKINQWQSNLKSKVIDSGLTIARTSGTVIAFWQGLKGRPRGGDAWFHDALTGGCRPDTAETGLTSSEQSLLRKRFTNGSYQMILLAQRANIKKAVITENLAIWGRQTGVIIQLSELSLGMGIWLPASLTCSRYTSLVAYWKSVLSGQVAAGQCSIFVYRPISVSSYTLLIRHEAR